MFLAILPDIKHSIALGKLTTSLIANKYGKESKILEDISTKRNSSLQMKTVVINSNKLTSLPKT